MRFYDMEESDCRAIEDARAKHEVYQVRLALEELRDAVLTLDSIMVGFLLSFPQRKI